MIFRLSQKLCTKLKAGKLGEMPHDENPYADWSGHLYTAERVQYVILTNTASLYSCVMYGKGITDDGRFIVRALDTIREHLESDGQQAAYEQFIAPASETVRFAKALNRSVTGSMNDLVQTAQWLLADDMTPFEVGFHLNRTPLSVLKYRNPQEAFVSLAIETQGAGIDV